MSHADTRYSDVSGHRLADLLEQISDRLATDRDAEVEQLLNEYPQFADRLRVLLPAMRLLANVGKFEHSPLRAQGIEGFTDGVHNDLNTCQISEFRILREIGRGGMGVVYEAEQMSLARRVALKVLPMAGCLDPQTLQRFRNEARAVAGLNHPHIVPVYAVGNDRGVHFYAMQLIDGQSLADVIFDLRKSAENLAQLDLSIGDKSPAGPDASMQSLSVGLKPGGSGADKRPGREYFRQVARWGIQAAVGLHHAHEAGIVHRDIKPSNLLVTSQGHLWITDFGLAMTSVDSDLTLTGDILGTLRYMSPEQTRGSRQLLDQRTDVYALGMTLYELLTLEPAYCEKNRAELLRQIELTDPCPVRKRNPSIPVELQTIVMKAVDRDPALRYQTTRALADDLERWLADVPILARPSGWVHRATKWSIRNRTIVGAGFIAMFLSLLVLMVSTILIVRERNAARESARSEADHRRIAVSERDEARYNLYVADINLAHQAWNVGNISRMTELLDRHRPLEGNVDHRGWEWKYLTSLSHDAGSLPIPGDGGFVFGLDWSPDGRQLALCGQNLRIWDHQEQRISLTLKNIRRAAWSPDGQSIAVCTNQGKIQLIDPSNGGEQQTLGLSQAADPSLSWAPAGRYLATGDQVGNIHIWNTAERKKSVVLHDTLKKIRAVAWSPDGRYLAAAGNDGSGSLEVWDPVEHRLLQSIPAHGHYIQCLAWSTDGRYLATGSNDQFVKVWDAETWTCGFSMHGHRARVNDLDWSPDGRYLISSGDDSVIIVWEPSASRLVNRLHVHRTQVKAVAWSKRLNQIVSTSADPEIRLVDPMVNQDARPLDGRGIVRWSPNGLQIVTNGQEFGTARVLNAETGQVDHLIRIDQESYFKCVDWSSDGKRIAFGDFGGNVWLWDAASEHLVWHTCDVFPDAPKPIEIRSLCFSRGGDLLMTAGTDGNIRVRESSTGQLLRTIEGHNAPVGTVCWSPDGRRFASKDWTQHVRVWNAVTWTEERHWQPPAAPGKVADSSRSVAWSPESNRLAAGTSLGQIVVWDVSTGQQLLSIQAHSANVRSLDWSSDGRLLASGSEDQLTKIWDAETGYELLSFDGNGQFVAHLEWSPDSRRLAVTSTGLRLFETDPR